MVFPLELVTQRLLAMLAEVKPLCGGQGVREDRAVTNAAGRDGKRGVRGDWGSA
jgi:hypothetical protein